MKSLLSTLAVAVVLSGCKRGAPPDPRAWFVESYEDGVITVRHAGNFYKATCETRESFTTDHRNDVQSSTCDMPVDLVGHKIRDFDGKFEGIQRDADGRRVLMWNVGSSLILRSWRTDEAWTQEWFKITSVGKTRR